VAHSPSSSNTAIHEKGFQKVGVIKRFRAVFVSHKRSKQAVFNGHFSYQGSSMDEEGLDQTKVRRFMSPLEMIASWPMWRAT
jgi:hypothetical protein